MTLNIKLCGLVAMPGLCGDCSRIYMSPAKSIMFTIVVLAALARCTCASPTTSCEWEDFDAAVQRFSQVLRFETVSDSSASNHVKHPAEFANLDAYLHESYPLVFSDSKIAVEKVGVDDLSYLITWPGSDPGLLPMLFISHLDVVPVPEASVQNWTHPPFSGAVADGYVWGRGAMDIKVSALALLEALSDLAATGFEPQRSLVVVLGQDEEVGGALGAGKTAELLASRGAEFEAAWDEGAALMLDTIPGVVAPFALVATAEKGYQSAVLHISSQGGHSSMPPVNASSVASIMARILSALDASPPPPHLLPPVIEFLQGIGQRTPGVTGWVLRYAGSLPVPLRWLLARVMARKSAPVAALLRMTVAVTRVVAGVADNVLPQQGRVNINLRLLPGQDASDVLAYLQRIIGGDAPWVTIELAGPRHSTLPSNVSDSSGPHFKLLKQAIQETWSFDGAPVDVVPFLLPGGTDSKHYAHLVRHGIVRFTPLVMSGADVARVHGTDERCGLDVLRAALCMTRRALQLFGSYVGDGGGAGASASGDDGSCAAYDSVHGSGVASAAS